MNSTTPVRHHQAPVRGAHRRKVRGLIAAGVSTLVATAAVVGGAVPAAAADVTLDPSISFPWGVDRTFMVPMGATFDGTHYWSVSGGAYDMAQVAQYAADGTLVEVFAPGYDFRAISSTPDGRVFASTYNSDVVLEMVAPGVFSPFVTLPGANPLEQANITVNETGTGFISVLAGTVMTWDMEGEPTGTVTLAGWGSEPGEYGFAGQRIAEVAGLYVTPTNTDHTIWAWSATGERLFSIALNHTQTSINRAYFSLSATQGRLFRMDAEDVWHGFDIATIVADAPATVTAGEAHSAMATIYVPAPDDEAVTFDLYAGDDATCSGTPLATSTANVSGSTATSDAVELTVAGTYRWVATYHGYSTACDSAITTVEAAELERLELSPAVAEIAHDATQTYAVAGFDAYDNTVDVTSSVQLSIEGGTCDGLECSAPTGTHTVTATVGAVSTTATLTVAPQAPVVIDGPADVTALTGGDAEFTVVPGGGGADVQWQSSTDGTVWDDVPGAEDTTLTLTGITYADDGTQVRAVLTNTTDSVTSDAATLTVPDVVFTLRDADGVQVSEGAVLAIGSQATAELSQIAPGATFGVAVHSEPVTVASITAAASATGSASFALPDVGTGPHAVVITDANGVEIARTGIVLEATAVDGDEDVPDELSDTGANVVGTWLAVLAFVAGGLALVMVSRTRLRGLSP